VREGAPAQAGERVDPGAGPVFTPMTVQPRLRNSDEVVRALRDHYPPLLRDAGIGGTARVWVLVDEEGVVRRAQLATSSGYDALDQAALRVAGEMRFTPARNRDEAVQVWVALPVTFGDGE
jgi:TonB family protein